MYLMKVVRLFFFITLFQIGFILDGYTEIIDYIAASVDGEIITFSELKEKLVPVVEQYNKIYTGEELNNRLKKAREDALNESIEGKILLINAENLKIEVTAEEIEKSTEEFKKKFSTTEEFYAELKKEGLTLADFKKITESKIKVSKFIRLNILKDIRITEEDITNFYEENKDSFLAPGQVKISQILIKNVENNEADKRIEEISQRLEAGEDFSALAKLYSEGPNASGGGDLGFVYPEQLNPEIRKALTEIEVGQYTKPIRTTTDYHIIKLEAKKLPQYAPVSDVKDLIKKRLYDLKVGESYQKWLEDAKKDVEIVIFTP